VLCGHSVASPQKGAYKVSYGRIEMQKTRPFSAAIRSTVPFIRRGYLRDGPRVARKRTSLASCRCVFFLSSDPYAPLSVLYERSADAAEPFAPGAVGHAQYHALAGFGCPGWLAGECDRGTDLNLLAHAPPQSGPHRSRVHPPDEELIEGRQDA
jgi:hypothetical protein